MKLDLLAGLTQIQGTRRKGGPANASKFVVDVVAPEFPVDFDDEALAGAFAVQLVDIMRANVLSGNRVDGSPAPPISQATIERREYRLEQARRGGAGGDRYSRKEKTKQRRNFKRRFKATKMGKFDPSTGPSHMNIRGVESGLLIKSMVAERVGKGWRIFFANIRSLTDRKGSAPVQRALGIGGQLSTGPLLSKVVKQPAAIVAANNAVKSVVLGKKVAGLADLLRNLGQAVGNVQSLAEAEV